MSARKFPENFIWGTATSAYQVEGAGLEDGKGPSIWNEFEKRPGAIADDVDGMIAADEYHHVDDDIAIMRGLGVRAYRFSVAWSRVLPEGRGRVNEKGMAYYLSLCDKLLSAGIEPYVTLYHWDLPLALQQELGGWESRDCVELFGEYASLMAERFGSRVKNYFTTNEFLACSDVGYSLGSIAPGLQLNNRRRNQVRHHLLLAHGTALQALRAVAPHAKVGLAENPRFMMPVMDTPDHVAAAKKAFREVNAHFITAVMEGRYPDCYWNAAGADAPEVREGDFARISAPMDFLGLNLYFGRLVRSAPENAKGYEVLDVPNHQDTGINDGRFEPDSLYWGCRIVHELWNPKEILISENGISTPDRPRKDGKIIDTLRIKFLRSYLGSLQQAVAEGYPVTGYFHWSLLDNLEWHCGIRPRFGLTYVNYHTGARTLKLSGEYFREVIRKNQIP